MSTPLLIVVGGPTASGKTSLALDLARHFRSEILSADSRQFYRELNIGTAKPTTAELQEIKHYFINTHSIQERYSAGQYGTDAFQVLLDRFQVHPVMILCGGSGLYIQALLKGFDDLPEVPATLRERLSDDFSEKGLSWLQAEVERRDPAFFARAEVQNPRRLLRALELLEVSGKTMADLRQQKARQLPFRVVSLGLNPGREVLAERIDHRTEHMVAAGLFEEARQVMQWRSHQALQTVGYEEPFGYFDGQWSKEEAIEKIKINTRQYAKRQMTWFRKYGEMQWISGSKAEALKAIEENIS
ncbi:MAG: tRNA (adenosine(37)-N6)-dimethylallyltransferase MiaA [Cyclobacteriaceae bacterium]